MKTRTIALCLAFASLTLTTGALAHCEIPCGIYGDEARFAAIQENITTIEKSMVKIEELSDDLKNINQLTRWVNNKEHHADDIRQIVTQYFMTQRIKLPDENDAGAVLDDELFHAALRQLSGRVDGVFLDRCRRRFLSGKNALLKKLSISWPVAAAAGAFSPKENTFLKKTQ